MEFDLVTTKDLKEFKTELLTELKNLLSVSINPIHIRSWDKGDEVKKMLSILESKLRSRGLLMSSKIEGTHYYHSDNIEKMLVKYSK